jgi:hypothetical protein
MLYTFSPLCYNPAYIIPCSSVAQLVEQPAVNRRVAGSSPARGATFSRLLCSRVVGSFLNYPKQVTILP